MLTKREKITLSRLENVQRAANVLTALIGLGFKNLPAILAITQHYYPGTSRDEILSFWHFRKLTDGLVTKMEDVLEKLKLE